MIMGLVNLAIDRTNFPLSFTSSLPHVYSDLLVSLEVSLELIIFCLSNYLLNFLVGRVPIYIYKEPLLS